MKELKYNAHNLKKYEGVDYIDVEWVHWFSNFKLTFKQFEDYPIYTNWYGANDFQQVIDNIIWVVDNVLEKNKLNYKVRTFKRVEWNNLYNSIVIELELVDYPNLILKYKATPKEENKKFDLIYDKEFSFGTGWKLDSSNENGLVINNQDVEELSLENLSYIYNSVTNLFSTIENSLKNI